MQIVKLDFKPRHSPSAIHPPVVWQSYQVSGFDSELAPQIVSAPLTTVFRELYPTLSFCELARLLQLLKKYQLPLESFYESYGLRDPELAETAFNYVLEIDEDLQEALSEKQFHLSDIRAILPPADLGQSDLLRKFIELRMSKSQIVEACELGHELMALGKFSWPSTLERESVLLHFRRLRFSESSGRDSERSLRVKEQNWPLKAQAKWIRSGDQSGIEIKMFATSPQEFRKFVSELSQIQVEGVWNSSSPTK